MAPNNPPKAWLVHGFNVRDDGRGSIDRLGPYIESDGWVVCQFDYGWTLLGGVLMGNPSRARELARHSSPGDIAIGHSNGCAIIHRATHLGAHFDRVIYVNPALDVSAAPGPRVKRFDVFHAPDDGAVSLARLIPGALWGSMGRDGYQGPDKRAWNWNLNDFMPLPIGHSGAFERIGQFGAAMAYIVGVPR